MNYRHIYHAGSFADAFKHIVLVALTQALLRKATPFCFLDIHAGLGVYDLADTSAQKSNEAAGGIRKIVAAANPPPLIQDYLACVAEFNNKAADLRYYPGSPMIVRELMRAQDRMVLTELHDETWQQLKDNFYHDRRVGVHHQDGYQALKAFLPPKERRGLILIDPPYEKSDELAAIPKILGQAIPRFETGVYALWYPIKEKRSLVRFHESLKNKISRPVLLAELCIYPEDIATELNGCGMAIVNPPFQVRETLK
ncbi:MAG: 23S rRNA (adenine(2030)-N(6))-methyltransferase RlmJ, partial [Pseudomonadota bacterium]